MTSFVIEKMYLLQTLVLMAALCSAVFSAVASNTVESPENCFLKSPVHEQIVISIDGH